VILDANVLRDDILYACRQGRRTVLVTAANAGLLRLFCAQHVVDEVVEHSAEWATGSDVSHALLLRRWLLEYLPVIRVIPFDDFLRELLDPDEAARIRELSVVDPDDVPSATMALLLEAFYLSNDTAALTAVYGRNADLAEHRKWLEVLKAGGDAGELGRMFHLTVNFAGLLGSGVTSAVRRLVMAAGPWSLVPLGLVAVLVMVRASPETKQRFKTAAGAVGAYLLQMYAAYQQALLRFQRVVPAVPSWEALGRTTAPGSVLLRACLHTLARSPMSDRSAAEVARLLPVLGVPQGESKVRQTLRAHSSFREVWRGRWQVGQVAPALAAYIDQVSQASA
jgi:predicted nucleic acid-binding protein